MHITRSISHAFTTFEMYSITALFALSIVFQYKVFGESFYDDSFDFQRRAATSLSIEQNAQIILNHAKSDDLAQLQKNLPACLALPNSQLDKLVHDFLGSHPVGKGSPKRFVDYMRRFESDMEETDPGYFDVERRAGGAQDKALLGSMHSFLAKVDADDLKALNERFDIGSKSSPADKDKFTRAMVEFVGKCSSAKAARRLFQLREFLEEQMMNEDY